jgi:hypothetical protein
LILELTSPVPPPYIDFVHRATSSRDDDPKTPTRSCGRIIDQLELMQAGVRVEASLDSVVQSILHQPGFGIGDTEPGAAFEPR